MAISPRLPNTLVMGEESISTAELMTEATSTADRVISLLGCWAEIIITMDSTAGPATSGMASGTIKGSSSLGLACVSSSLLNTSLMEMMNRIIPPAILMEKELMPNICKNHLPRNRKATVMPMAISSSRINTVLRRSGATFFSAETKRGMLPKGSITRQSVITEEKKKSIKTP